jgi:hypothetical protein
MMPFTDMTGLASSAVAMAGAAFMAFGVARIPEIYRSGLACAVAVAGLIPFGDLPLAAYVRGVIGDLSIPSLILMLMATLRPIVGRTRSGNLPTHKGGGWRGGSAYALFFLAALAAIVMYPMALGLGSFDPYRLGFGNQWLLAALLAVAMAAYLKQLWLPAFAVSLAVLAWSVGWLESANLWDYLFDPLLAIYAIGALAKCGVRAPSGLQ